MIKFNKITKTNVEGRVELPLSKSISNRILLMYALENQLPDIDQLSDSNDVKVLYDALTGNSNVDMQDAGTPLRFFLAFAAFRSMTGRVISGSDRLKERSIMPLLEALESLGAEFIYHEKEYCLPLEIFKGIDRSRNLVKLRQDISSQFVSALLLIAPYFEKGLKIETIGEKVSGKYIDMTISMMRQGGVEVDGLNDGFHVKSDKFVLNKIDAIEPDWSSAAFVYALVSATESADVFIKGLKRNSIQGDSAIADLMDGFGVSTVDEKDGVRLKRKKKGIEEIEIDFKEVPDLFPVMAALCSFHRIKATFKGIRNLRDKESDRVQAMHVNLIQTGAEIVRIDEDTAELKFISDCSGRLHFSSFNDHRIAMACSIFAYRCPIVIDDEMVVAKSFPNYWEMAKSLFDFVA